MRKQFCCVCHERMLQKSKAVMKIKLPWSTLSVKHFLNSTLFVIVYLQVVMVL